MVSVLTCFTLRCTFESQINDPLAKKYLSRNLRHSHCGLMTPWTSLLQERRFSDFGGDMVRVGEGEMMVCFFVKFWINIA